MLLKIILVIDTCIVTCIGWQLMQGNANRNSSILVVCFAVLIVVAWLLRNRRPGLALVIAAVPVLAPLLVWIFLAAVFFIAALH
jgi:hypothetical protein